MGFDLEKIQQLVATHGQIARVVIADVKGSSPREVGAAMLVWQGGQSGTIGGGALELAASKAAFSRQGLSRHALGPELGQCCGGAVTLLTEVFDADRLAQIDGPVFARGVGEMPMSIRRILSKVRREGEMPEPRLLDGWYIEPVETPARPLWIWGAGHVGRAMVTVLADLPDFKITWVDTSLDRFPSEVPEGVDILAHPDLVPLMAYAPRGAEHLILTYSHALDLDLCHAVLETDFAFAGVIGSKTKWVRFRARLAALGHSEAAIQRITCPIGQKALGKHPMAIAVGVAAALLGARAANKTRKDRVA